MGRSTASITEISELPKERKKIKPLLCPTSSKQVSEPALHRVVAQILLVSSKGVRYNRAVAFETLDALHAVENDEEALQTFFKEREQRAIAIKKHAQELTEWKEQINSVNQAQGYDALTRRRDTYVNRCPVLSHPCHLYITSSMTERLVQLGYSKEEIKRVPSNLEFDSLMSQPRDLTPFSTYALHYYNHHTDNARYFSMGTRVTQAHRGLGGKQNYSYQKGKGSPYQTT